MASKKLYVFYEFYLVELFAMEWIIASDRY